MKEIIETYKIYLQDYDDNGHLQSDGVSMRDVLFEFERDFHQRHSTRYALFMYANSSTMKVLARSCGAPDKFIYGMDLYHGNFFDPLYDPDVNYNIDKKSNNITVFGIDSAYMVKYDENGYPIIGEDEDIYPLTLLTDSELLDGIIKLTCPDDDDDDDENKMAPIIADKEYMFI